MLIEQYATTSRDQKISEDWPDWPSDWFYYTPPFFVGGFEGSKDHDWGFERGLIVIKLEVWYSDDNVLAIRLNYSDGSQGKLLGTAKNNYAEFELSPGETIISAIYWGNGVGKKFGKIKLQTSAGRTFEVGKKNVNGQTAYPAPVGSGILTGASVRCGKDLNMLGLLFLDGVMSARLGDVNYIDPPPPNSQEGLASMVVSSRTFGPNVTDTEETFSGSMTYKTTQSWTESRTTSYFSKVTISATFFDFGASAEAGWQTDETTSSTLEISHEFNVSWSTKFKLPAGDIKYGIATTYLGELDLAYTANLHIEFKGGYTKDIPVSGTYTNVCYSKAESKITDS